MAPRAKEYSVYSTNGTPCTKKAPKHARPSENRHPVHEKGGKTCTGCYKDSHKPIRHRFVPVEPND